MDQKGVDKRLDEVREETNCEKRHQRISLVIVVAIAIITLIISLCAIWAIVGLSQQVRTQQSGAVTVVEQVACYRNGIEI